MMINQAYRGTRHEALSSQHYAIYATTDIDVATRYSQDTGRVYTLDLSAVNLVSVHDLPALFADSMFDEYADIDPTTIDLDLSPLLGVDPQCYSIADALGIDGIVDDKGNIEIYNGLDITVLEV